MFLIEVHRDCTDHSSEIIEQEISTECQPPFQDEKTPSIICEVLERTLYEIIEAVVTEVVEVRGVGEGIRRAVVWSYRDHFGARFGDPVDFGHDAEYVRLMLQKMGEVNPVGAIVPHRPGKMLQFALYVGQRAWLAIEPEGACLLLLLAAADVQYHHARLAYLDPKEPLSRGRRDAQRVLAIRKFAFCARPKGGEAVASYLTRSYPPCPIPVALRIAERSTCAVLGTVGSLQLALHSKGRLSPSPTSQSLA